MNEQAIEYFNYLETFFNNDDALPPRQMMANTAAFFLLEAAIEGAQGDCELRQRNLELAADIYAAVKAQDVLERAKDMLAYFQTSGVST